MVQVTIGTATNRKNVVVDDTVTIATILQENNVPTEGATFTLNGFNLQFADMNKTLKDLGITEKATLIVAVKTNNA